MVMSWIWTVFTVLSAIFSIKNGTANAVTAALVDGAKSAVELSIALAGPLCLWSGIGVLMERTGLTGILSALFSPLLHRIFPSAKNDASLSGSISANFCANLLGLGNAATPMGIQAVQKMVDPMDPKRATDEMCRLVVMNTASIQLIPTTVATLRRNAGASHPMDILLCVWVSSLFSVSMGLLACYLFSGRRHG